MSLKTICLFDTTVVSRNTGDQVIMDAVRSELLGVMPNDLYVNVQTHDFLSLFSYHLLKKSDLKFVGGSNLLASNQPFFNQWIITPLDTLFVNDAILMGAGWWQYQGKPNLYTRFLLRNILSKKHLHAVRDEYTKKQLASIGITNVVNTACPSMWQLSPKHCAKIPQKAAKKVVVTLTVTHSQEENDLKLLQLLQEHYQDVFFWPQQPEDFPYIQKLQARLERPLTILPANLPGYDAFMKSNEVDYVGTRLHAGIRALQHGKRTMILAIDNRATEISRDTNLPVLPRHDLAAIEKWITTPYTTEITLPTAEIERWKAQFK